MKSAILRIALAAGIVLGVTGQASALNMHVPRAVIEAALVAPVEPGRPGIAESDAAAFRAFTERLLAGARRSVVDVMMPGLMLGAGSLIELTPIRVPPLAGFDRTQTV